MRPIILIFLLQAFTACNFFSSEKPSNNITLSGMIHASMAIGGESTGYTLKSNNLTTEVDFRTYKLESKIPLNKKVTLEGEWKEVESVERKKRKIFVVKALHSMAK